MGCWFFSKLPASSFRILQDGNFSGPDKATFKPIDLLTEIGPPGVMEAIVEKVEHWGHIWEARRLAGGLFREPGSLTGCTLNLRHCGPVLHGRAGLRARRT